MSTLEEHQRANAHHRAELAHKKAMRYIQDLNIAIDLDPHEPWSEHAKKIREHARTHFVGIVFNFPSSPLAQSFYDLWLNTTHTYLKAITAEASHAKDDLDSRYKHQQERCVRTEKRLWNAWRQYRIVVKDDVDFYKKLIDRVVHFFNLRFMVEESLELVDITLSHDAGKDGHAPEDVTEVERKSKRSMVCDLLVYLGDLERYSCQLDDLESAADAPKDPDSLGFVVRSHKSQDYYQAAVTLNPDNGHAYNSLAIVYQAEQQDLKTIYYYIRASTARRPFRAIDAIIHKRGHARTYDRSGPWEDEGKPANALDKYLDAMGMIHCQSRLHDAVSLVGSGATLLAKALMARLVPSDDLVKLTICLIGTQYRARHIGTTKGNKHGEEEAHQLAKETAVAALSTHFRMLCEVAMSELFKCETTDVGITPADDNDGSNRGGTQNPSNDANTDGLAPQLSSVLRRMLPSLRIMSKWLKCHVEYLRRHVDRSKLGEINRLWATYATFMIKVAEMFPIYNLPSLMGCLEEDIELRGFSPLTRTSTFSKRFQASDSDEEHLMRVSDLSVEAVLVVQQAVDLEFLDEDVLERLHALHRPQAEQLTEWEEIPAELASEAKALSVDKGKSTEHGRNASQNTDDNDDEEEIVYTPPMAQANVSPRSAPAPPVASSAASAQPAQPAVTANSAPTASEPAPTLDPAIAPLVEPHPLTQASAPASVTPRAPRRAITAMDLVEQIGRRYQGPVAAPLQPPLPIGLPTGQYIISHPPGLDVPLAVMQAGPPPGFGQRPTGHAGQRNPGTHIPQAVGSPILTACRPPGPPPGFEPRHQPMQATGPPPGYISFPPHIPASQGLFGALPTAWTLSREESEEGIRRSLSHSSQGQSRPTDPNAQVPRVHSGSSLIGQDGIGIWNTSMSRAVSQPLQSRSHLHNPPARVHSALLWPTDFRDDMYLLAGRAPPDHYHF